MGTQSFCRVAVGLLFALAPCVGWCQISAQEANLVRAGVENRIEALTILGGDFGLSGGTFTYRTPQPGQAGARVDSDVTKGGGAGDVGDPQPLGILGVGWQPRLQGNMGYLSSRIEPSSGLLAGDTNEYTTKAIEFGGGARFWLSEHFSIAPTFMGLYGQSSENYTARSPFMRANQSLATQMGLIDWRIDTWTARPALNLQYVLNWGRTIITLSSDPALFHTQGFTGSNANVRVNGNSTTVSEKVDIDAPIGIEILGHELRTGGYLSRTDLSGDLSAGLDVQHMNEAHARLVLDFRNQLWKVQWIGIGASYITGTNIHGWTLGADVAFRF
jgi:hypothetical protein